MQVTCFSWLLGLLNQHNVARSRLAGKMFGTCAQQSIPTIRLHGPIEDPLQSSQRLCRTCLKLHHTAFPPQLLGHAQSHAYRYVSILTGRAMVPRGTKVPSLACALCIGVRCDIFKRAANPLEGAQCCPSASPSWSHDGPMADDLHRYSSAQTEHEASIGRQRSCILGSRSRRYVTNSSADALKVDDSDGV
jgi:hypothetical protein